MSSKKTLPIRITTRLVQQWDGEQYVTIEEKGYWYDGPLSLAHEIANTGLEAWRVYDSSATAIDAQDTDPVTLSVDTDYQVCLRVKNTSNDTSETSVAYQLQYNLAGGGWNDVNASSSVVQSTVAGLTDESTYGTDRLTGGTETRDNGYEVVDGVKNAIGLGVNTYMEVVFGITIVSGDVTNGQNIDLRLTFGTGGSALDFENVTPSITVSEAVDIPIDDFPAPLRYDLTGLVPTLLENYIKTPGRKELQITEQTPVRIVADFQEVGTGSLTLTAGTPQRARKLNLTGLAPTVGIAVVRTPAQKDLQLTGQIPTVGQSLNISVPTGTLTLDTTNKEPTIVFDWVVFPAQETLLLTGEIPTADTTANHIRAPPLKALALTGLEPSTGGALSEAPGTGTLDLNGLAPTIVINHIQSPAQETLAITGAVPLVSYDWVIPAPKGSLALTGKTPQRARRVNLTGYEPTLVYDWVVTPSTKSLSLTGLEPVADVGGDTEQPGVKNLSLTGLAPTIGFDWVISPDAGGVVVSGEIPTAQSGGDVTRDPGTKALSLTGQTPIIGGDRTAEPATGSLSLTGLSVRRPWEVRLIGQVPSVINGPFVQPGTGGLSLTGLVPQSDAGVIGVEQPGTGSLGLTGHTPALELYLGGGVVSLQITGYSPSKAFGSYTVKSPGTKAVSLTGAIPTIDLNIVEKFPGTKNLSLTGQTPLIGQDWIISPNTGSLTTEGKSVTFAFGFSNEAFPGTGSGSFTGLTPIVGYVEYPGGVSVSLTGNAPTLDINIPVGLNGLSLASFNPSADVGANRTLQIPKGSLSLTSQNLDSEVTLHLTLRGYAPQAGFGRRPANGSLNLTGLAPVVNPLITVAGGPIRGGGKFGDLNRKGKSKSTQRKTLTKKLNR